MVIKIKEVVEGSINHKEISQLPIHFHITAMLEMASTKKIIRISSSITMLQLVLLH